MPLEYEVILHRLHTAEGHLHAINQMVESKRPCHEVLHQLDAVQCAIEAVSALLLHEEIEHCLEEVWNDPSQASRNEELTRLANLYQFTHKHFIKSNEPETR